jgi:hypothetical protein
MYRPRAIGLSLCLLATPATAQQAIQRCIGAEVRSIDVSTETGRDWPLNVVPEMEVLPQTSAAPNGVVSMIVAYGPILASGMDSRDIKTKVVCTGRGFRLEATIVRFAEADVLKNVLWRPRIELTVFPRQAEVVVQTVWKMRMTDRKELDHARTPPYPEQRYPITVTRIVGRRIEKQ